MTNVRIALLALLLVLAFGLAAYVTVPPMLAPAISHVFGAK